MSATVVLYVRRLDVMRAFYQERFGLKITDAPTPTASSNRTTGRFDSS
ncbi:MAG TPA: hypothetical protein VII50_08905 [Acidothermaceae bacterium]